MVADRPRLREDRLVRAAQLLEQHEVLHVAGAKLDDTTSANRSSAFSLMISVTIGRPV